MNTIEQQEILRNLLDRVNNGEEVVMIDDSPTKAPKYDPKTYVMRRLKLNADEQDIFDALFRDYGIKGNEAVKLVTNAKKNLQAKYQEYVSMVAEKNVNMLQQMLDDAIQENQKRTALEIVKELNKMCGVYAAGNVYVNANGDQEGKTIEITFK